MAVIAAQPPVDTEYLIGETECEIFDERGGVFHSYKHGVTVIFPTGAIPSGILAELKFAATLISPIPFLSNKIPVSPIFWLCMDSELQKPIQIHFPLMRLRNNSHGLQFAKSLHSPNKVIEDQMDVFEGGKFIDSESYGSIEVTHFCYYCIVDDKLNPNDIPQNQYLLVAMKQSQPSLKDNSWSTDICLVPYIPTCFEVSGYRCIKMEGHFK